MHICTEKAGTEKWAFAFTDVYDLSVIAFFPWGKVGQPKHAVGDVKYFLWVCLFFLLSVTWDVLYTYVNITFVKTALELALLK